MPSTRKVTSVEEYYKIKYKCLLSYRNWPKSALAKIHTLAEALFECKDAKKQLCQCFLCGEKVDVTDGNKCIRRHQNKSQECRSTCERFSSNSGQNEGPNVHTTQSVTLRHDVVTTSNSSACASNHRDTSLDNIQKDEECSSDESSELSLRSGITLDTPQNSSAAESDPEETEVLKVAESSDQVNNERRDWIGLQTAHDHLHLPVAGSLDEVIQSSEEDVLDTQADHSVPDKLKCLICWEREKRVCLLFCGHLCCCSRCAVLIEDCPVCGNHITHRVQTYWC